MQNTALITGASSGIGKELAIYHASKGGDLVLVARREEALNKLKEKLEATYKVEVSVIVADLSESNSAADIFKSTEDAGIEIDILINNAGFGGHGNFDERDLLKDQAMMQVNIVSLVNLTHMYLQGMKKRNWGKILNVASTAAFLPGPLQAVYYATKSFVVSFSQAIAQELSSTSITVTALCPGTVATEFVKAGDLEGLSVWDNAATAESVAKCGYDAMLKGDLIVINEWKLAFMFKWILPFLSRKMVLKISQGFMKKK